MKLLTEIKITPLRQAITYGDGLLFLGSCFADEVGSICRGLGFNAQVNPFGALYNPVSLAQAVARLGSGTPFTHDEVIQTGEEFCCTFFHNTTFWSPSEAGLLERVNAGLAEAHAHFLQAKWVILSLGTAWVFREKASGQVVANCHKLPADRFLRERLTVDQCRETLAEMLQRWPDKQFLFTVSPLRHLKDGLHENQLSKSTLLLAVDALCQTHPNAHYFPAYELLLDELRDYRFYQEDLVHPTPQAVQYIWERFAEFAVNPSEQPAMAAAKELKQMLQHKPLFPESQSYQGFEALKERKIAEMKARFPEVRLEQLH